MRMFLLFGVMGSLKLPRIRPFIVMEARSLYVVARKVGGEIGDIRACEATSPFRTLFIRDTLIGTLIAGEKTAEILTHCMRSAIGVRPLPEELTRLTKEMHRTLHRMRGGLFFADIGCIAQT